MKVLKKVLVVFTCLMMLFYIGAEANTDNIPTVTSIFDEDVVTL